MSRHSTARLAAEPYAAPASDKPHRARVLIIDDDASMRRFVEKALAGSAVAVDSAADGEQAFALLADRRYDAVFTDIAMPGMSGLDVLRAAHDFDPDVPVVLITGSPALETAIGAVEYGAFRYLLKPVSVEDIVSVTERAIRLHALSRLRRRAFDPAVTDGDGRDEIHMLAEAFERALAGLYMVYQPIVSSREGRVYGYEALVRTTEPALASPTDLIAAAERLKRVDDLSRRIRFRVGHDAQNAPEDAVLFVNLHPEDLEDDGLYARGTPFNRYAHRIVLEITERASLEGIRDIDYRVSRLRALGFRLAVDDLGTAYSGLTTLARIEPDIVKLDMMLARGLASKQANVAVVRSMVQLCVELGMGFVCEGVETVAQRDAMVGLGCDLFQGYLYAPPGREFRSADDVGLA